MSATTTTTEEAFCWSRDSKEDSQIRLEELVSSKNYLQEAKLIVFDKDGTLGDDQATLKRWALHMTGRFNSVIDESSIEACLTEFHSLLGWDSVNNCVLPSAPLAAGTWQEQVDTTKQVLKRHGLDPSLADDWHQEMSTLHSGDDPVIDDLKEMLLSCRDEFGLGLAVCTSDVRYSTDVALARWKVDDIIPSNSIVCADQVDNPKPNAEPLHKLLQQQDEQSLTLTPNNCIVVGDTVSDSGMARNAKALLCIGVLTGSGTAQQLYDTGADIVLPSVGHIPALLTEIRRLRKASKQN